jgi:hypothetical protein
MITADGAQDVTTSCPAPRIMQMQENMVAKTTTTATTRRTGEIP